MAYHQCRPENGGAGGDLRRRPSGIHLHGGHRASPCRASSSTPRRTAARATRRSRAPTRRTSDLGTWRDDQGGDCWSSRLTCAVLCQAPVGASAVGEPAFGCGHVHTAEPSETRTARMTGRRRSRSATPTMLLPDPRPDPGRASTSTPRAAAASSRASGSRATCATRDKLPKLILINAYGNGGVNDEPDQVRAQGDRTEADARSWSPPTTPDTGAPARARHRRARKGGEGPSRPDQAARLGQVHACPTTRRSRRPAPGSCPTSSIRTSRAPRAYARTSSRRCCRQGAVDAEGGASGDGGVPLVALRTWRRGADPGWRSFSAAGVFQIVTVRRIASRLVLAIAMLVLALACSAGGSAAAAPGTTRRPRSSRTLSRSRSTCAR